LQRLHQRRGIHKMRRIKTSTTLGVGLLIAVMAIAAFRGFFAFKTSFWCDEICWIFRTSGTYSQTLHMFRTNEGPLGPFDISLIYFWSKFLILLGVDPHLALRFQTILFSLLAGLVPFVLPSLRKTERWAWFIWCALSTPMSAVALNARPYAGLVFFSVCGLFAAVEIARSKGKPSLGLWALLAVFSLAGLSHPYVVFFTGGNLLLLFLVARGKMKQSLKLAIPLLLSFMFSFAWFKFLRAPVDAVQISWQEFFRGVAHTNWRELVSDSIHMWASPGSSLKIIFPFFVLGMIALYRKGEKLLCLFLITAMTLGLFVPLLLNIKFNYFYASRQTLAAYPIWGWSIVSAAVLLWENRSFVAARYATLGALLILGGIVPLKHWVSNEGPFVDLPRYRLRDFLPKHTEYKNRELIVTSSCQTGPASLYLSDENFRSYFEKFRRNEFTDVPVVSGVIVWTNDSRSCSGLTIEKPSDPDLVEKIQKNPKRYVVFAPYRNRVPKALQALPCIDETGRTCTY
jgi:hypothetical protein